MGSSVNQVFQLLGQRSDVTCVACTNSSFLLCIIVTVGRTEGPFGLPWKPLHSFPEIEKQQKYFLCFQQRRHNIIVAITCPFTFLLHNIRN